jgi:chromosome segregation protein
VEIDQAKTEITASTENIGSHEKDLKEIFEKRTGISSQQSQLEHSRTEILNRINEVENDMKKNRSERDSLYNEKHQLEMQLTTHDSNINAISNRISEEYEINIQTEEISNPDESLSAQEAEEKLTTQKEQLKKYGAVNLLALEEYKTSAEREKFLGEQIDDLTNARNDLKTTITKINKTARKLFLETFEKVQENFQKLFVELFTGGEASISLVEPDNPLESDIEIIARPRGKKLISITMMSGGERALTAISLLFSLYLVKPSPFCILDEIDAPLDDANCRRFLKIIETFSNNTQFITITHNKITMEVAHNLYGVTMEQPGISQIVAVRFTSDDDDQAVLATGDDSVAADQDIPLSIRERIGSPLPSSTESDNPENY